MRLVTAGVYLLIAGSVVAARPAIADTAIIGTKVSPSSMDPQLGGLGSDQGYYRHIYDALYMADEKLVSRPGLATSHRIIDDLTWEFVLRRNVKFHDGSDFDASDVAFTFERIGTVPGSDGLQEEKVRPIERIEVMDPFTIRIHTRVPTPYLLKRLVEFWILPDSLAPGVTTEELNRGKAIGTGPFRLVEWRRGNQLILQRNVDYWGEVPDFNHVIIKEMHNDATRVAALQSGDVDMIDYVPPLDTFRLHRMSKINVFITQSARVIFLQLDTRSASNTKITHHDGTPISPNPLQDRRVRKALQLAISRDLIIEKIMENTAVAANQAVPQGFEGFDASIPVILYRPDEAKRLLAEAGLQDGFRLTLSCPNDRYINDAIICQAIGQLWTRIGVRTHIETMPKSVYFSRMLTGEFAAYMLGWGNTRGDSISVLKNVIHSRDPVTGGGTWNPFYSNPALDRAIDDAITIMDQVERRRQLNEIMSAAMDDVAIIPLYTQPVIAATREDLVYTPVPGEETLAIQLKGR